MSDLKPAEAFHPGKYVCEMMSERGWVMRDLAKRMGCEYQFVDALMSRRVHIGPALAKALSGAFETSPDVWINLQRAYDGYIFNQHKWGYEEEE